MASYHVILHYAFRYIWSPSHLVDTRKDTIQLMNSMCYLTHFVTSSFVQNINRKILENNFIEGVALSFGMTALIVMVTDRKFRSVFEDMYTALKIHLRPQAQGNHKGILVEKCHRFLNKTQTIMGQDRGSRLYILQNPKTSQYAWNSTLIETTEISQSLVEVTREFRLPLDIEISAIPELNNESK